jgi:hypothetical protein
MAQLQRARLAVVRALPADALIEDPSASELLRREVAAGELKHLSGLGATNCR